MLSSELDVELWKVPSCEEIKRTIIWIAERSPSIYKSKLVECECKSMWNKSFNQKK